LRSKDTAREMLMGSGNNGSEEKLYSEAEVAELVERRVVKHDVDHLRRTVSHVQSSMSEQYSKIDANIGGLYEKFDAKFGDMQDKVTSCRDDLRDEIERDFVTKPEFITRVGQLEGKVDRQWVKTTTAITVVITIAGFVLKLMGVF